LGSFKRYRFALLLDACLALASGTGDDLFLNVLPDEHQSWAGLIERARQKTKAFRRPKAKDAYSEWFLGMAATPCLIAGMLGKSEEFTQPDLLLEARLQR
jgi:hypothetical protein